MLAHLALPALWAAVLAVAAWTVGRPVVAWTGADDGWTDRLALPWAAGMGIATLVTFALAQVGAYRPGVLMFATAITALLGAPGLLTTLRRHPWPRPDGWAALAGVGLLVQGARAFTPDVRWDSMVYHLPLPKAYLAAGGMVALPWNFNAGMPHGQELLYGAALAGGGLTATKLLAWQHDVVTAGLLIGLAGRLGAPRWAGIVACLFLGTPEVQRYSGTAYTDLAIGTALCAALAVVVAPRRVDLRRAALVGLLLGWAMGMKYTAWLYAAAALVPLLLDAVGRGERTWAARLAPVVVAGGVAALIVSPWLLRGALVMGNPIWPNAYGVLGGRWWSEVLAMQVHQKMSHHTVYGLGAKNSPIAIATFVWRVVLDPRSVGSMAGFAAVTWIAFLASPAGLVRRVDPAPWLRVLSAPWTALVVYLALPVPNEARYLLPVVPWMALAAACGLSRLPVAGSAERALQAALIAGLGAQATLPRIDPAVLTPSGYARAQDAMRPHRWSARLHALLPADGRTWFAFENRLWWIDRPAWSDSQHDAPATMEILRREGGAAGLAAYLRAHGTTHVVVNPTFARGYLDDALRNPVTDARWLPSTRHAAEREAFERFVQAHLVHVETVDELDVYTLVAADAAPVDPPAAP